jgi:predicted nucleic acid-binding protein
METRLDRFTAFVDANVLYAVLRRDIILSLAETGAFRVRWSARVLDEVERALARRGPPMTPERAASHRAAMERAFNDACVEGFESLEASFSACPDPNDAHVIAAAVHCRASVIVTENLRARLETPSRIAVPCDAAG